MTAKKGKTERGERPNKSEELVSSAKDNVSPEIRQGAEEADKSPCKSSFQIYRDAVVRFPKLSTSGNEEESKDVPVVSEVKVLAQQLPSSNKESRQCPFSQISQHNASQPKLAKRCKKPPRNTENAAPATSPGRRTPHGSLQSQQQSPTDSKLANSLPTTTGTSKSLLGSPPAASRSESAGSLLGSPPGARQSSEADAAPSRRFVAPLWTRERLLAAAGGDSAPRSSDISGALCAAAAPPAPWWAPPPIDKQRRAELYTALQNANKSSGDPACDQAVEEAVRAVLYRRHPTLIVQRCCKPPGSLYGNISAEEFILHGTRPVHVRGDLFLGPAMLSREDMLTLIRNGQYYRGHIVACFYAYLYAYEFVFFCEYLRQVQCHTEEARLLLNGVIERTQNMHLITNSATIFSLAPEAMFPQRSPFLYVARLFPMEEPWEVDLLCDMVNCRDLVGEAARAWNGREHVLFTTHRNMCREARRDGRPLPTFHPAVIQAPSSKHAHSLFEGEDVQRSDSHGLILYKESGATYTGMDASSRYQPLGELSTEEVLRRSIGRHALIRLFDDVFYLGAPPADTSKQQFRYLRPAEARLHIQVGFYFESPSFTNFLWDTQRSIDKSLRDACRVHAPQLSRDETALVRWLLSCWVSSTRKGLQEAAQELARLGPFLLSEYNRLLWVALQRNGFHLGALKLCSDLSEFSRAALETALAEHNCLDGN